MQNPFTVPGTSFEQSALSNSSVSSSGINSLLFNSHEQNLSGVFLLGSQEVFETRTESFRSGSDPDQRKNPNVRKRLSGPAIRTFFNIADKWGLSVSEQCGLLGWIAPSTYHKYKSGKIGTLTYDGLVRISLVIGIYKALHILYPDNVLADRWVKLPNENPIFSGKPALSIMIENGIDGLYKVRRLLDSRRGGWN